jgi:hypothetical protein
MGLKNVPSKAVEKIKAEFLATDPEIPGSIPGFGPLANYTDRATAACWRS